MQFPPHRRATRLDQEISDVVVTRKDVVDLALDHLSHAEFVLFFGRVVVGDRGLVAAAVDFIPNRFNRFVSEIAGDLLELLVLAQLANHLRPLVVSVLGPFLFLKKWHGRLRWNEGLRS